MVQLLEKINNYLLLKKFYYCGQNVLIKKPALLKGCKYITIGDHTRIDLFCYLTAWDEYKYIFKGKWNSQHFTPKIIIGTNCNFGAWNHITAINQITIGNGCLTGKWVTITDNAHGANIIEECDTEPALRKLTSKGPVIIKDNVWIGDKVTILPGVTIGTGCIIGANSTVTRDIPDYCICGGNPAQIIKRINK